MRWFMETVKSSRPAVGRLPIFDDFQRRLRHTALRMVRGSFLWRSLLPALGLLALGCGEGARSAATGTSTGWDYYRRGEYNLAAKSFERCDCSMTDMPVPAKSSSSSRARSSAGRGNAAGPALKFMVRGM